MSWVWDEGTTRVERRMGVAGWGLEDWFCTFAEAVRVAVAFAREHGRRASVVRDPEYAEPWQVWVR